MEPPYIDKTHGFPKMIYKCWVFHIYVRLQEGNIQDLTRQLPEERIVSRPVPQRSGVIGIPNHWGFWIPQSIITSPKLVIVPSILKQFPETNFLFFCRGIYHGFTQLQGTRLCVGLVPRWACAAGAAGAAGADLDSRPSCGRPCWKWDIAGNTSEKKLGNDCFF